MSIGQEQQGFAGMQAANAPPPNFPPKLYVTWTGNYWRVVTDLKELTNGTVACEYIQNDDPFTALVTVTKTVTKG